MSEDWRIAHYEALFVRQLAETNRYKAMLFDAWKTMSGQSKGLKRQARKIKRMTVARDPEAYLVEYREIGKDGSKKCVAMASLEPREPTIMLPWDENVETRELLKATPLFAHLKPII
jgi:hypothetical protein